MLTQKLPRRAFLRSMALASLGTLVACAPKVVKETVVVEKTVEKVVKETVQVKQEVTKIVEKVVVATPAPAGKQVLRYWLPPTTEQVYRQQMINEFMQMNPDIEVKMEGADPAKYNEATQLLFSGGTPPDVFWLFNLTMQQMLEANYIQPYPEDADNYIKNAYPKYMFLEGVNLVQGKLMGFWPVGKKSATRVLYINNELWKKAGLSDPPKTWNDFRDAAKKLTAAGKGQFYGLILGGKSPWDYTGLVGALAYSAGPMASANGESQCFDWTKAEMTIAAPYIVSALKLCLDMVKDGSLFPGFTTITHTEARAGLPSNWAGMFLGGWWDSGNYVTQFPKFDYTIAAPPAFGPEKLGYNLGDNFISRVFVSKGTKVLNAVSRFLLFKFGPAYQKGWARNGWFTTLPDANTPENISEPKVRAIFAIAEDIRAVPDPVARNPEESKVKSEIKALHPNWGELLEGAFTGKLSISDYEVQAKEYASKWRAELERAIKELKGRNVRCSIDDWIFPNWDPKKDYTDEMYKALPAVKY